MLPEKITIIEVGTRDGFQFEKKIVPTSLKIKIISDLINSGLKRIQVTSFVNPKIIPQLSDAEEIIKAFSNVNDVYISALTLNKKGVFRAINAGLKNIDISISASNTHSVKNTGMNLVKARKELIEMICHAKKNNMTISVLIQCSFGCFFEGNIKINNIIDILNDISNYKVNMFTLCDTTGMANPLQIKKTIKTIKEVSKDIPIGLHLHDTYGIGLANVFAALEMDIRNFDTSFGSIGGCPFIPNAPGNISTENTVYMLESMGIKTGVDIKKVTNCSNQMKKFFFENI